MRRLLLATAVVAAACAAPPGASTSADAGADLDAMSPIWGGGRPPADAGEGPSGPSAPTGPAGAVCFPVEEVCDAADNDCDGEVDEIGCPCTADPTCFAGPPEARGLGECRDGARACDDRGELALACEGGVGPSVELCDGLDNDCDGLVDDDCCLDGLCGAPPEADPPPPRPDEPDAGFDNDPDPEVEPDPEGPCDPGGVAGLVCAPDGSPVAGARVFADTVDCDGRPVRRETVSDAGGGFLLEGLAPGPVRVIVEAGQFRHAYDVNVRPGEVASIDAGGPTACIPQDAAAIAATTGDYDEIEAIVQRLGFEPDVYCGDSMETFGARALLGDAARLGRYDLVFVNCGLGLRFDSPEGQQMIANVRQFVAGGGSLYVSDLAAHLVAAAWPEKVTFRSDDLPFGGEGGACCTCIDCPAQCGAQPEARAPGRACMGTTQAGWGCDNLGPLYGYGPAGSQRASVRHPALAQALGRDALDIEFDLDEWVEIDRVGADVEVLVEAGGRPLMVRFGGQSGSGRVVFTSFHNHAQLDRDVETILRALVFQL